MLTLFKRYKYVGICLAFAMRGILWFLNEIGFKLPPILINLIGVACTLVAILCIFYIIGDLFRIKKIRDYWKISLLIICFLFLIGILSWVIIQSNPNYIDNGKTDKVNEITVEYLFNNDFKNIQSTMTNHTITTSDGRVAGFQSRIYMNFTSKTKFAGYFIPESSHSFIFMICDKLAGFPVAFQAMKDFDIEFEGGGLSPVDFSELTPSGRVFIYHEVPLFLKEKQKLIELFKKFEKSVEFRGVEYLTKRYEKGFLKIKRKK